MHQLQPFQCQPEYKGQLQGPSALCQPMHILRSSTEFILMPMLQAIMHANAIYQKPLKLGGIDLCTSAIKVMVR